MVRDFVWGGEGVGREEREEVDVLGGGVVELVGPALGRWVVRLYERLT